MMKNYNMVITTIIVDTNGNVTWYKEEIHCSLKQEYTVLNVLCGEAAPVYLMVDGKIVSKLG